jgi:hypothetical protein
MRFTYKRKSSKNKKFPTLTGLGLRTRGMFLSGVLAASSAITPVRGALLGHQLFPPDYPWNQNISNAPVAANSAAIIGHIGVLTRVVPNFGADNPAAGPSPLYGIPYNVVHGNTTARVNVIIDNYPSESDIVSVPIPPNAVLEGDYQNGPNPHGGGYNPNQRGDSHLIVWDEDNNVGYELYGVSRPSDPTLFPNTANVELPHTDGLWHAAQETVWNFGTDNFRTLGESSADAAGLSILAGLARPDEGLTVAQGGQGLINHALRVTLPGADLNPQYIYPGSHMVPTSQGPDNLSLGSRLRLQNTPAVNALINNMPPQSQIIARAMQQYGLIVADIGSAMYVGGAPASVDANNNNNLVWDMTDLLASNGLEVLRAANFDVVNLTPVVTGLSASSGQAGSALIITGQNFSGAAGHLSVFFGSTAAGSANVLNDTQISVTVPNGSGTMDVTVQSGVNETDIFSGTPNANVNAPIFGYGTSAKTPADKFTYTAATASTVTAVSSSSNPSVFGQPVTFAATVTAVSPGTGTPTGTVTFLDGGSPIGTGTLIGGVASFTAPAFPVGSHAITASYGGGASFNGSTGSLTSNPQVVNKANTTTSVKSSLNPSHFNQPVTFTATVSPVQPGAGTPSGPVIFLDGGVAIANGTLSGGVATFTTSALAPGNHTITTSYSGDGNFNGSTGSPTGNPQFVEDFKIAVTPASETIPAGSVAVYAVTVSTTTNFTGAIYLTCSGGPAGSTCKVLPSPITLTFGVAPAIVIVELGAPKSPSTSTLTITGTSGATTHSASVSITVK